MYCKKCGAYTPDDAEFCTFCGTKMSVDNTVRASQGTYSVPTGCTFQKRDIALAIVFTIITFGIYGIYWFVHLVNDVNEASGDHTSLSGGVTWLLSFVTCGIYGHYWYYLAGKKMNQAKRARNIPTQEFSEILYLLLSLFGFGIVASALIQNDLNQMAA